MSKIREEELIMLLKTFINNIWDRAKNLRPSNVIDENTEMSHNKQGNKTEMTFCEDSAGLYFKINYDINYLD